MPVQLWPYVVMTYIGMAYTVKDCIQHACIVMAWVGMAYKIMAYIVMACCRHAYMDTTV